MFDCDCFSAVRLLFNRRHRPQVFASFAASTGLFALGTIASWTSPALPSLLQDEVFRNISTSQESWIASLVPLGALISGPISGASLDFYGRKLTLIIQSAALVIGWLLIAFSRHIEMLYAGRFITGLCAGSCVLAPVVYITDVSESEVRGKLGSITQIVAYVGVLFTYLLGSVLAWNELAVAASLVPIVTIGLMVIVPESPRFLLENGKVERAVKSLCWLRGGTEPEDVQEEIETIQRSLSEAKYHTGESSFRHLFRRRVLRPLFISMGLMVLTQFVGFNALLYFTVQIFTEAGSFLDPNLCTVLIGILLVVSVPVSTSLIDRSGRRALLLTSAAILASALFSLGLYFFLKEGGRAGNVQWLPLAAILVFFAAYGFGIGTVPWLVMTEIIPNEVVGTASGICTSVHFICGFLVAKYFESVAEGLGTYWPFWIFSIVSGLGFVFVFLCVPETKLKTLEEIQAQSEPEAGPLLAGSQDKDGLTVNGYSAIESDTDS